MSNNPRSRAAPEGYYAVAHVGIGCAGCECRRGSGTCNNKEGDPRYVSCIGRKRDDGLDVVFKKVEEECKTSGA